MRRLAWLMVAALVVLALPLAGAAQAQTGRVTGTVSDATGAVLPGVTVTIKPVGAGQVQSAVTDSAGRYVIANVPPGAYELSIELAGFEKHTEQVVVPAGQPVNLETKLQIGGRVEAIQVTGTLIPRPTLEAMSPVTTLEVEELTYRGMTRMEDLLMSLPQIFAAQNSTVSNGSSGTATVDLRFLGTNRTLVLLDGRRMGAGDTGAIAPDLNFIPSALVKRVDVLTGGASTVYGADAVAGVVNFVLDKEFEGIRGGIEVSGYQHNNDNALAQKINTAKGFTAPTGSIWNWAPADFNVALGGKFGDGGRGHATLYADYRHTTAMTKDQRDYTNCSVLGGLTMNGPTCGGSGTWPAGRFLVYPAVGSVSKDYVLDLNSSTGDQLRPRTSADVFNYAPYNFMQRPDQRLSAGGFLNYDWNKHVQAYGEVMFMDDITDAQIAPSGDFGNTSELNCDNPMLSDQQRKLLCTDMGYGPTDVATVIIYRRNVEGGGRIDRLRHLSLRTLGGVKGDINNVWKYDIFGMQHTLSIPRSYANDLNANNIQDALLVSGNRADPSSWTCSSGNPSCVPWNIFKKGGVTQDALTFLQLSESQTNATRTRMVNGRITGDFKDYGLKFPWATEAIKVAFGGEYRSEYLAVRPDQAFIEALGAGSGGPTLPVEGKYNVKEFFTEALVPFAQDVKGFKDLSLELGYRLSDYSTTGRWGTYKVQGSWAPISDIKIRAGFNRATRSPNIVELFTPQGLGLGGDADICAGSSPSATQAQCALQGVTAGQYGNVPPNPAGQYNTIGGGNPDLSPETANTWTGGLVLTPRRTGFTLAVDYYNIKIDSTIGTLGSTDIQNQCAKTGLSLFCGLIHRDRFGSTWATNDGYIIATNQNIGKSSAEGLDVNGTYTHSLGSLGLFTANVIGSYLMHHVTDTGLYDYDCAGYFGNVCSGTGGTPLPKWRHLARFSWETKFKTVFSVGWRMVGPVTNDVNSPNTNLGDPSLVALYKANAIDKLDAHHYVDFGATWKLMKNVTLIGGVNNLLDKEPPLGAGMSANDYGTGFFGTYDPYGRYLHVAMQFTF